MVPEKQQPGLSSGFFMHVHTHTHSAWALGTDVHQTSCDSLLDFHNKDICALLLPSFGAGDTSQGLSYAKPSALTLRYPLGQLEFC